MVSCKKLVFQSILNNDFLNFQCQKCQRIPFFPPLPSLVGGINISHSTYIRKIIFARSESYITSLAGIFLKFNDNSQNNNSNKKQLKNGVTGPIEVRIPLLSEHPTLFSFQQSFQTQTKFFPSCDDGQHSIILITFVSFK
jgi:hypothetical protein